MPSMITAIFLATATRAFDSPTLRESSRPQVCKALCCLVLHSKTVAAVTRCVRVGVPPVVFGGEDVPVATGLSTIAIPVLGPVDEGSDIARIRLVDEVWLRQVSPKPNGVSIVMVEGDAMEPTLLHGDEVFIQRYQANENPRDGIYVIRTDTQLLVRRIALEPARGRISVLTDNPTYPAWNGLARNAVQIVGKVVWIGRRIA